VCCSTGDKCKPGFLCDSSNKCQPVPRGGINQPCLDGGLCNKDMRGLVCTNSQDPLKGTCVCGDDKKGQICDTGSVCWQV
jgi:hypothetical protein